MSLNHKYYINFPIEYHWDNGMFLSKKNAIRMLEFVKENHRVIYDKLQHGDFIENGTLSGYRSDGLYMVEKKDNICKIVDLSPEPDEYGTIPIQFIGLKDFLPLYNLYVTEDKDCNSCWHNTLFPIDTEFLRNLEIKKIENLDTFTYSECEFQNKRIIIIYPKNYIFTENIVEYYHCSNYRSYYDIEDYIAMIEMDDMEEYIKKTKTKDYINQLKILNSYVCNYDMFLGPYMKCLVPKGIYDNARLEEEDKEYNS